MSFAEMIKQEVAEAQAERSIQILKKFFGQNKTLTFGQLKEVLATNEFLDDAFGKVKLEDVVRVPPYREKISFNRRMELADKMYAVIKSSKTTLTKAELLEQVEESDLIKQVFGSLVNILVKAKRINVEGKGKFAKFSIVAMKKAG